MKAKVGKSFFVSQYPTANAAVHGDKAAAQHFNITLNLQTVKKKKKKKEKERKSTWKMLTWLTCE